MRRTECAGSSLFHPASRIPHPRPNLCSPKIAIRCLVGLVSVPSPSLAQATLADYQRAMSLRDKHAGLALNVAEAPRWIEQTSRFYYRKTVKGGHEWVLVDGATHAKQPAFDHARLATAIAQAAKGKATATELPFTTFTYVDAGKSIEFTLGAAGGAGRGAAGGAADVPPLS